MITSDLEELNIDQLDNFEGDPSHFLVENGKGIWQKLVFDPFKDPSGFQGYLVLKNDQILVYTIAKEMKKELDEVLQKNAQILKTKRTPKKKVTKRGKKSDNK